MKIDHIDHLEHLDQWEAISVRHGFSMTARTECAKFVVDLEQKGRVYFFNSRKWETHYQFVIRHINPLTVRDQFFAKEYNRDDRRYLLGSILHYLDGNHWTVELTCGDNMRGEQITWLIRHIAPRIALTDHLCFRPSSPQQIEIAEAIQHDVPILSLDALNASIEYQPVVVGEAYGYLRFFRGPLDVSTVRPNDIVVIDHVPDEIPPVAALVTSELQAPLAHVAVLSRNRNNPDMALRGATHCPDLLAFEGKLIKLTVGGQDYQVERATIEQAQAAWAGLRPAKPFAPERDLGTRDIRDVHALPADAACSVGAKAAQLHELMRVPGIEIPGGFALPFTAYAEHVRAAGLDDVIDAMLADPAFVDSASLRAERLAALRERIEQHPVDAALLQAVADRLRAFPAQGRVIFRSSSNAEDLAGFNGAGLYESTPVAPNPSLDEIADALRSVWASVWLQRAYEEREWYRIDHRSVAMGILVQPFVERAIATGVAITGNPFKPNQEAVLINAQVIGATVTGATGNQLPEQHLVLTTPDEQSVETLSRSSLAAGSEVLTEAQVWTLTRQLRAIHDAMVPARKDHANAMDVEFVLTEDGRFIFVQARPYTIVYSADRARAKLVESTSEVFVRRLRKLVYMVNPFRFVGLRFS